MKGFMASSLSRHARLPHPIV